MEIRDIIAQRELKIIAEVGVYEAGHAGSILECAERIIDKMYLVDPWTEYGALGQIDSRDVVMSAVNQKRWDKIARHVYQFGMAHPDIVRIIRLPSIDAAELFADNVFDLVYIDADHSYLPLLQDIISWLPKIKDSGIISGHDFTPRWPDVCRAVEEIFGQNARHIAGGGQWFVDLSMASKFDYYQIALQLKNGAVSE
jgi:predicted O-methyltransferase YrrM